MQQFSKLLTLDANIDDVNGVETNRARRDALNDEDFSVNFFSWVC